MILSNETYLQDMAGSNNRVLCGIVISEAKVSRKNGRLVEKAGGFEIGSRRGRDMDRRITDLHMLKAIMRLDVMMKWG